MNYYHLYKYRIIWVCQTEFASLFIRFHLAVMTADLTAMRKKVQMLTAGSKA
jgi:hypothetical protein